MTQRLNLQLNRISILLLGCLLLPVCSKSVFTWSPVDSRVFSGLSVSQTGIWAVVVEPYRIFYKKQSYNSITSLGGDWQRIAGFLGQLDVGLNMVWGVSRYKDVFWRVGITADKPTGKKWLCVGENFTHVSVSDHGHVWAVKRDSSVVVRTGVSTENPGGTAWTTITTTPSMAQISVGHAGVWAVDDDHNVFYRTGTYGDAGTHGTAWTTVGGSMKNVCSGHSVVMGLGTDNQVYTRTEVSTLNPTGTAWEAVGDIKLRAVACVDHKLFWGLNEDGHVVST